MNVKLLKALLAKYEAEYLKSEALLDNYLNNSVGIGEHPDIVVECVKIIDQMDHAKHCIDLLKSKFEKELTSKTPF